MFAMCLIRLQSGQTALDLAKSKKKAACVAVLEHQRVLAASAGVVSSPSRAIEVSCLSVSTSMLALSVAVVIASIVRKHVSTLQSQASVPAAVSIECSVCREEFGASIPARKPRLLACAHTFCTACVDKLRVLDNTVQ